MSDEYKTWWDKVKADAEKQTIQQTPLKSVGITGATFNKPSVTPSNKKKRSGSKKSSHHGKQQSLS